MRGWSRRCARPAPRRSGSTSSLPSRRPIRPADTALAAALGPDVTLAGDETLIKTPHADQTMRVEPLPEFLAAGAKSGIASIVLDNDGTLRRVPRYPDGFAAVLAEAAGAIAADVPAGALLQTFGPARTFPTVSYYQALSPDEFLPKDFFRGTRRHRRAFHAIGAGRRCRAAPIPTRPRSRCAAGIWCRARKSRRRSTKTSPGSLLIAAASPWLLAACTLAAALLAAAAIWRGTGWLTAVLSALAIVASIAAASCSCISAGSTCRRSRRRSPSSRWRRHRARATMRPSGGCGAASCAPSRNICRRSWSSGSPPTRRSCSSAANARRCRSCSATCAASPPFPRR